MRGLHQRASSIASILTVLTNVWSMSHVRININEEVADVEALAPWQFSSSSSDILT